MNGFTMGNNGLDISLEQFKKMNSLDRDVLIYQNVCAVRGNKVKLTFAYIWLFLLTVVMGLRQFLPF